MFTNRFYFSAKQQEVADSLRDDGRNFIVLSTGMEVPYTEWCSSPDAHCRWDDARLVYASDTEPQLRHEWGEEEKEDWDRLIEAGLGLEDDLWGDLDEPDDMSAEFEAYEQEAQETWDKWMDNRPGPEEGYVRGEQFNQDT